jgi:hypothetical protein
MRLELHVLQKIGMLRTITMQKPKLRSLFMPTLGLKMRLNTWIHPPGSSYVPNVAILPLTPYLGYVGNKNLNVELEEGEIVP